MNRKLLAALLAAALSCAYAEILQEPPTTPNMPALDTDALLLARLSGLFEVEDPESIFSYTVSDKDVEFLVDGSWDMQLSSVMTVSFSGSDQPLVLAPPVLTQAVELSSWVFLDRSWYFESSFAEEFTKNTVAAGFAGKEGNPVRHVRAGNSGIAFPDVYPFLQYGDGGIGTPGISASFSGESWRADSIIRYDATARREKVYSGSSEITETLVPATAWISGKWFALPEAPVADAVTVFVQDDSGDAAGSDGRRWKKLDPTGFRFSGTTGILELAVRTEASVAVAYADADRIVQSLLPFLSDTADFFGGSSGPAVAGRWLDDPASADAAANAEKRYLSLIDGSPALLLREKGSFSPFMICSRYEGGSETAAVVHAGTGIVSTQFRMLPSGESWSELAASGPYGFSEYRLRSNEQRFPLATLDGRIYLPSNGGVLPDTDLAVRTGKSTPVDAISLGTDALAGTITVTRNGFPETGFSFDGSTGILVLLDPPRTGETIRISWMEAEPSSRNASLILASGMQWTPSADFTVSAGAGTTWNISGSGYTDAYNASPGQALLSAGVDWNSGDRFSFRTELSSKSAVEISVEDTTGLYRLFGADGAAKTLYPEAAWYRPMAPERKPVLGEPFAQAGSETALEAAHRIDLEGSTESALRTVKDPAVTGSILDFSAELTHALSWAAAEILSGSSGGADLSAAESVSLALKNTGDAAQYSLYLQAGSAQTSTWEDPSRIRTWKLESIPAGAGWTVRTVRLTPEDRAKLAASGNVRLIAVLEPSAAGSVPVRLLSGPLEIIPLGVSARSVPETEGAFITSGDRSDPAPEPLAAKHPETAGRFNAGKINRVLEASFSADDADTDFEVSARIPSAPFGAYREFGFFAYLPKLPASSQQADIIAILSSTDRSGQERTAARLVLQPGLLEAGKWHNITVHKDAGTVAIDGIPASGDSFSLELDEDQAVSRISFLFRNWPVLPAGEQWSVYIDEAYLGNPEPVQGFTNETKMRVSRDGPMLKAGNVSLIASPWFGIIAKTNRDRSRDALSSGGTVEGGVQVIGARLSGAVNLRSSRTFYIEETMYSVSVPFGPFAAEERFSAHPGTLFWTRYDKLDLAGPLRLSVIASSAAGAVELTQKAEAAASASFGSFSANAGTLLSQTIRSARAEDGSASGFNAYPALWKESAALSFSTGEPDASRRTGAHSAAFGIAASGNGTAGLSFRMEASSSYAASSRPNIKALSIASLSLPVLLDGASITPSWTRSAGSTAAAEQGGSYGSDSSTLALRIRDFSALYAIIPGFDVASGTIPGAVREAAAGVNTYANKYSLEYRRATKGVFSDLYMPSTASIAVQRDTETDEGSATYRDTLTIPVKAGFSALNVAGRYSARGWFSWYEQDEFTHLYAWTAKRDRAGFSWSFDASHSASLFFAGGGTVSADNSLRLDAKTGSAVSGFRDSVRMIWKRPADAPSVFELLSGYVKLELSTRREDSIGITLEGKEKAVSAKYVFDHTIAASIGKNGEIRIQGGATLSEPFTPKAVAEIRAAVGGKLTF